MSTKDIKVNVECKLRVDDGTKEKLNNFYNALNDIPNINCIIETHGQQHYEDKSRKGGRTFEEEQENDEYKYELAIKNGISKYIAVDCRSSDMEYIKDSILKSELNDLFDLFKVDWLKCHEFACSSLVKKCSDLWNSGYKSTHKIANILSISRVSVNRYLRQSVKFGWCDYNGKKINADNCRKLGLKQKKLIVQLSLDGNLIKIWNGISLAKKELQISNISTVCSGNGKQKTAGGYKWMYKEDYDKLMKAN